MPKTNVSPGLIAASRWAEIAVLIDSNPDLVMLRQDWKAEHKVENTMKLTAGGQQSLLKYMRERVQAFPF